MQEIVAFGAFSEALYKAAIEELKAEGLHGPELEKMAKAVTAQIIKDMIDGGHHGGRIPVQNRKK